MKASSVKKSQVYALTRESERGDRQAVTPPAQTAHIRVIGKELGGQITGEVVRVGDEFLGFDHDRFREELVPVQIGDTVTVHASHLVCLASEYASAHEGIRFQERQRLARLRQAAADAAKLNREQNHVVFTVDTASGSLTGYITLHDLTDEHEAGIHAMVCDQPPNGFGWATGQWAIDWIRTIPMRDALLTRTCAIFDLELPTTRTAATAAVDTTPQGDADDVLAAIGLG